MLRILNVSSEVSLQADHFINLLFILIWGPPRLSLSWDKVITVINHVIYKQVMHTQVCGVTCVLAPWNPTSCWSPGCMQYLQYVVQHSHVQQHSHMTMWPFRDSKCVLQDWDMQILSSDLPLTRNATSCTAVWFKACQKKSRSFVSFYMTRNNKITAHTAGYRLLQWSDRWIILTCGLDLHRHESRF